MKKQDYFPFKSLHSRQAYLSYNKRESETWPVPSKTAHVATSYGQTFVRISGPENAPVLVLLPGSLSTSLMWKSSIKRLSEKYRTYAIDNIFDVGLSINTTPIKNTDSLVKWLNEVFHALNLEKAINIMGMSYSGWLTARFALQFPQKLNKIVLIAPAATVLPFNPKFILKSLLMALPFPYFTKQYIYWLLQDMVQKDQQSKQFVDNYIDELIFTRKCFGYKVLVPPTVLSDDELKNLAVPALFLVGENEKMYSADKAVKRLTSIAPQVQTEMISAIGHDLLFMNEEYIIGQAVIFLDS